MAVRVDVRDLDQAIADGFVRQLGAGSYGSVWYWRSAVDQREMAVKKVNKADARRKQVASGGTLDPIEQARTEALVMRSLSHPNIVSVYDFVETPDALYLMLEYCPGGDLLALLNRVGRLDEPTAAVYFRQLVDAVTYIHRSGFVHRDIKVRTFAAPFSCPFYAPIAYSSHLSRVPSHEIVCNSAALSPFPSLRSEHTVTNTIRGHFLCA